jgi:hypothetical protein
METVLLIDTEYFSQTKIILSPGETAEEPAPETQSTQTIYVQSGIGFIKTSTERRPLSSRSFEVIQVDSQLEISNTGPTLLTVILTVGK